MNFLAKFVVVGSYTVIAGEQSEAWQFYREYDSFYCAVVSATGKRYGCDTPLVGVTTVTLECRRTPKR